MNGGSIICKLGFKVDTVEPSAYNSEDAAYEEYGSPDEGSAVRGPGKLDGRGAPTDIAPTMPPAGHRVAPVSSDPPAKTAVSCQWCVSPFDTPPVGMPTRKLASGKFSVAGVYCSLECACAHNFDVGHASHSAYTRHALCCEMASVANKTVKPVHITPAPPRAMLNTFGGPLDIEQFRNRKTAYTIVYPLPVVAQVHHAEEMSFSDTIAASRSSSFVPIDEETIDSFTNGLRRPVVGKRGFKSTLEYMTKDSVAA